MAIKARYAGTCAATGKCYPAGAMIEKGPHGWQIEGAVPQDRTVRDGETMIHQGEGYGGKGFSTGQVLRHKDTVLTVRVAWSEYFSDDGMSFGVGDEEGHVYYAICRPATDEEAAPILEAERRREEKLARQREYEHLFDRASDGEYLWGENGKQVEITGAHVRIGEGLNIYGGGEELIVETGGRFVWRLRGNGMDGDDWSRNNFGSSIATRYPLTEERLALIHQFPGAGTVLAPPEERRTTVLRWLRDAALKDASDRFRSLFEDLPIDARGPGPAVWVDLDGKIVGMTIAGDRLFICTETPFHADRGIYDALHEEKFDISDNASRVYLHYPATPERVAAVRDLWPEWVGSSDSGRFIVSGTFAYACDNAADALRAASIWTIPVNVALTEDNPRRGVRFDPGITVQHVDKHLVQWSDGKVSKFAPLRLSFYSHRRDERDWKAFIDAEVAKGETVSPERPNAFTLAGFPEAPPLPDADKSMSADAAYLISVAVSQPEWKENHRFTRLENVDVIEARETLLDEEIRQGSGGTFYKIERLRVRLLFGSNEHLWLATEGWWAMGEDGDVDSTVTLHESEAEARAAIVDAKRSYQL